MLSDTDANGNAIIDAVDFPALDRDVSYGRVPEGSGSFQVLATASPGDPMPTVPTPAIVAVALTSTPSIDTDGDSVAETYGVGETIEVTVTWDADVLWDVSAPGAALKLDLDIGGHTKRLSMVADGSRGTARALVFHYAVQNTDTDMDGIFPKPWGNSMVLLTRGATLTGADGRRPAWRVHAALAPDPAHQVDGGRLPSGAPNPEMPALPAPAIVSVALTSTPSIDTDGDSVPETYGAGETIEVTVTWNADVLLGRVGGGRGDQAGPGHWRPHQADQHGGGHDKWDGARAGVPLRGAAAQTRAPDGVFPKPWGNSLVLLTHGATLTGADGVSPRLAGACGPGGGPGASRWTAGHRRLSAVVLTSTPQHRRGRRQCGRDLRGRGDH